MRRGVHDGQETLETVLLDLAQYDLRDALADGLDLGGRGVGRGSELALCAGREADHEESEEVIVGGLDVDVGLDGGLPFAQQRAELVPGDIQTVEVGVARVALDVLHDQLDLPVALLSRLVMLLQVGQTRLHHTALQTLAGDLYKGRTGGYWSPSSWSPG